MCWHISYLSGLLTVPYQSSSYEPDGWDLKPAITVCACVCVCVAFKLITATWKQINSAVNSTPLKILCMYDRVRACARPGEGDRASEPRRECMLVWLVFSKPFEALNELIPSRYLESPTSIPSPPRTPQSTMQFISLSHPFFTHAYSNHLLINMHTLSLPRSLFSSRTHIQVLAFSLCSLSLPHTHSLKCQKQAPDTYICSTSSSSPLIS